MFSTANPATAPAPDRAVAVVEEHIAWLTFKAKAYEELGRPMTAEIVRDTIRLLRQKKGLLISSPRSSSPLQ